MSDNSKGLLYSVVTCGRNDNYNPDFLYRLQTTLNLNARELERIGRLGAVEFIVVDWGSAVPLRQALALEEPAVASTSFFEISSDLATQFSGTSSGMHPPRAMNVGIRRAKGSFVGFQGADLLMTSGSWRSLLSTLEDQSSDRLLLSNSVLMIPRRQVPWSFVARQPSVDRWKQWLQTCSQASIGYEDGYCPAVGGGMGIIVLHRNLWRDAKGLEENFPGWGYSDIDLVLRISAHHPWIDAGSLGVVCHKMQHSPEGRRGRMLKGASKIDLNPYWITTTLSSRSTDWGLPHLAIEEKKAIPPENSNEPAPAALVSEHWTIPPKSISPFYESDVCRHVSRSIDRAPIYETAEVEVLQILSWFGLHKFPMNYLEVGLRRGLYVRAVATACSSVDIYVLEKSEKNSEGIMSIAVGSGYELTRDCGHKGYFRAALGDCLSNFQSLRHSFVGQFEFEVIVLNLDEDNFLTLLSQLFEVVVPGGLFVIHAANTELLEAALKSCDSMARLAQVVRGNSGRTAFLFFGRKEVEARTSAAVTALRLPLAPVRTRLAIRIAVVERHLRSVVPRRLLRPLRRLRRKLL